MFTATAWAEPRLIHVPTSGSGEPQVLSHHFQILIDGERDLIPEDMVKPATESRFHDMAGVDVYQVTRGRFWLRVTLVNDSSDTEHYRLFNHVSYSDLIQLYQVVD